MVAFATLVLPTIIVVVAVVLPLVTTLVATLLTTLVTLSMPPLFLMALTLTSPLVLVTLVEQYFSVSEVIFVNGNGRLIDIETGVARLCSLRPFSASYFVVAARQRVRSTKQCEWCGWRA